MLSVETGREAKHLKIFVPVRYVGTGRCAKFAGSVWARL